MQTQDEQAPRGGPFDIVRDALLSLELEGIGSDDIRPESDLIEDLGMDSLKFVDLTVAIEDGLELERFPMQEWVDECIEINQPLTVGALVKACGQAVGGP